MNGIFGDTFDFDGDGKLDIIEQAEELAFIETVIEEEIDEGEETDADDY